MEEEGEGEGEEGEGRRKRHGRRCVFETGGAPTVNSFEKKGTFKEEPQSNKNFSLHDPRYCFSNMLCNRVRQFEQNYDICEVSLKPYYEILL